MKINLKNVAFAFVVGLLFSCNSNDIKYDTSGSFESTEIIVSSEASGKIIQFDKNEGDEIEKGSEVVVLDSTLMFLQKEQALASVDAVGLKQNSASPQITIFIEQLKLADAQINALKVQYDVLKKEQKRIGQMFALEAATGQQNDDINGKVEVLEKQLISAEKQKSVVISQIKSAKDQVSIQNRGISSEIKPLEKRVAQLADQLDKTKVTSPINGTLLTKYAHAGEVIGQGKPLFKLADLSVMSLRAYVTGDQLPSLKIGQSCEVFIDDGQGGYKPYAGIIAWISDKAEFTPKSIQTKDERANLVYATKIEVKNDGLIKIGMYGEVAFNKAETK